MSDNQTISHFPSSVYLGGGAWSTSFHIGVAKALQEMWQKTRSQTDCSLNMCEYLKLSGLE